MLSTWAPLIPLVIGSALVPVQIVITTLLLRSGAGRFTAVAWVAGMTTVRLVQGLVFGLLLDSASAAASASGEASLAASLLLLVLAIFFYVSAAKQLLKEPDEDAPAPRWMTRMDAIQPGKAYLLGVGLLAVGAKPWVFTLGAIAIIGEAGLAREASIAAYLVFVVLAESLHLALLGIAYAAPERAAVMLDGIAGFLERNNRVIVIGLGLVFGTWFLLKALGDLGII